jgi:hypothetical protein
MNKKAKIYVGLGVVAVVAYYFYHQAQMKKEAAAASAPAKFVGMVPGNTVAKGQSRF